MAKEASIRDKEGDKKGNDQRCAPGWYFIYAQASRASLTGQWEPSVRTSLPEIWIGFVGLDSFDCQEDEDPHTNQSISPWFQSVWSPRSTHLAPIIAVLPLSTTFSNSKYSPAGIVDSAASLSVNIAGRRGFFATDRATTLTAAKHRPGYQGPMVCLETFHQRRERKSVE